MRSCPIGDTFLKLRRDMVAGLGLDRRAVRAWMRLRDLIPTENRSAFWEYLDRGGPLTEVGRRVARVGFEEAMAPEAGDRRSTSRIGRLFEWFSRNMQRKNRNSEFETLTMREAVVYLNGRFLRRDPARPWSRDEISVRVRMIVAKNLDVPFERVRPESRFIEDLAKG